MKNKIMRGIMKQLYPFFATSNDGDALSPSDKGYKETDNFYVFFFGESMGQ